jgi:hypothetical protein
VSPSEFWPAVGVAEYQILFSLWHVLLTLVEREQESLLAFVVDPVTAVTAVTAGFIPLVVAETTESAAELRPHESQRVFEVVALRVEGRCAEAVFGSAEYPLQSHWLA